MGVDRVMLPMSKIKVLLFATLRERAGTKSLDLDIPKNLDVSGLREQIASEHPVLKEHIKNALVAIDREYAFEDAIIPHNSEIALFPPVSGG